jgi:toxin ParE1/3/4
MSEYSVVITESAEKDIIGIYQFIAEHDSPEAADYVLEKLESACYGLDVEPNRGKQIQELASIGVTAFRQLYFKPYKVIYQIQGNKVYIMAVIDGRRDLEELLIEKLLR